jgi:hypothetical protein
MANSGRRPNSRFQQHLRSELCIVHAFSMQKFVLLGSTWMTEKRRKLYFTCQEMPFLRP